MSGHYPYCSACINDGDDFICDNCDEGSEFVSRDDDDELEDAARVITIIRRDNHIEDEFTEMAA